jgi:hypothetical protein
MPYVKILHVPEGAFNLQRNFPSQDIKLIATTTNLLIDDRMHPAIQFLFLEAAREINGKESFFAHRGSFLLSKTRYGEKVLWPFITKRTVIH